MSFRNKDLRIGFSKQGFIYKPPRTPKKCEHADHADHADHASRVDHTEQACLLGDFRLRLTPEPVLQTEKMPDPLRPQVQNILQNHGFWPCKMEIGGSISGFYDAGGAGHKS